MHRSSAAAVGEQPIEPSIEPPIDLQHLFRMTLGDHVLEREVLALFDRQAGMLIARMEAVDAACVAALAHTLKGSARGVGAWPVARAAELVEAAAPADLAPAVAALATAAEAAHAAIVEILRAA
ncbi:MAG TPA: Hpt domain-containing protein [Xanthobacteraceae bacterium]|nr:Hpt domain-containing protein [Xanthobacteraceae bacterium]